MEIFIPQNKKKLVQKQLIRLLKIYNYVFAKSDLENVLISRYIITGIFGCNFFKTYFDCDNIILTVIVLLRSFEMNNWRKEYCQREQIQLLLITMIWHVNRSYRVLGPAQKFKDLYEFEKIINFQRIHYLMWCLNSDVA